MDALLVICRCRSLILPRWPPKASADSALASTTALSHKGVKVCVFAILAKSTTIACDFWG